MTEFVTNQPRDLRDVDWSKREELLLEEMVSLSLHQLPTSVWIPSITDQKRSQFIGECQEFVRELWELKEAGLENNQDAQAWIAKRSQQIRFLTQDYVAPPHQQPVLCLLTTFPKKLPSILRAQYQAYQITLDEDAEGETRGWDESNRLTVRLEVYDKEDEQWDVHELPYK